MVADEGRLRGQRLRAEGQDRRLFGGVGAEPVEDLPRRPAEVGRDPGDLVGDAVEVGLGPGQDRVGVRGRLQGQRELAGEQLRAEPGVGETVRVIGPAGGRSRELGQPGGEPVAVRRQRLERGRPGLVDLGHRRVSAHGIGRCLRDQRDRPVELGDRGLQVNLRHPPEACARRRQRVGHPRQPAGQRVQPLRQRRVVPRQQHVDRRAGVGEQRVPGVLAQLLDFEQAARHVARHQRGVHPQLRLEGRPVQVGELGGEAVENAPLVRQRGLRHVRQQLVEPVIAQLGGGVGVAAGQVVDVLVGEPTQLVACGCHVSRRGRDGLCAQHTLLNEKGVIVRMRAATHPFCTTLRSAAGRSATFIAKGSSEKTSNVRV